MRTECGRSVLFAAVCFCTVEGSWRRGTVTFLWQQVSLSCPLGGAVTRSPPLVLFLTPTRALSTSLLNIGVTEKYSTNKQAENIIEFIKMSSDENIDHCRQFECEEFLQFVECGKCYKH